MYNFRYLFLIYKDNFNFFPKLYKDLRWKFFLKPTYCAKCRKKSVFFAVYCDALLVRLWSSLLSRKFHSSIGIALLGCLPNASVNYWEFSDWSGHNWNVFLPCMSLGSVQLIMYWPFFFFLPSLFHICYYTLGLLLSNVPRIFLYQSLKLPFGVLSHNYQSPQALQLPIPFSSINENAGNCLHVPSYALDSYIASRQKAE